MCVYVKAKVKRIARLASLVLVPHAHTHTHTHKGMYELIMRALLCLIGVEAAKRAPIGPLQPSAEKNTSWVGGWVGGMRLKHDCMHACIHTCIHADMRTHTHPRE